MTSTFDDDDDTDIVREPVDDHLPPRLRPHRHPPQHREEKRGGGGKIWLFVLLLLFVGLAIWGILSRKHQEHQLAATTDQGDMLVVTVQHPQLQVEASEVILPGNVHAWHEASLSARVTGYLKAWHKDIGDHVKTGDLLAEIDTPETDAQLRQSEADLQLSIANSNLSQVTAQRWLALRKTDSVTQQETDEKVADAAAKVASVQSSQATVDRLRQLESFKRIVAPFDGVVTNRAVDIGQLVDANGAELYHVSTTDQLRVYVNMPQNYTTFVKPNMVATIHFNEHPTETFEATLLDTAQAIDPATRTLLVQFALPNPDGTLYPGGYAEAHLKVPAQDKTIRVPVNAVMFQTEGLQVAVVGADNKIAIKTIKPGRDFGTTIEVVDGLDAQDNIVINPPDSIYNGEPVRIAPPQKPNGGQEQQQADEGHKNQPSDSDKSEKKDKDKQQKQDPAKQHGMKQDGQGG